MKNLFLALLSGVLLSFSWPAIGFFPFIFFAFVPLLILEEKLVRGRYIFFYSYISFFIFNVITTYWVWYATPIGSVFAFLINSFLMSLSFYLFHKIRSITNNRLGGVAFIVCWLSFEYLHLNWDLSWPWLTLGNVFSDFNDLVQWYEYTGVLGGTLWVLLINMLLFEITKKQNWNRIIITLFFFIFPLICSYSLKVSYANDLSSLKVLIVQPNIDPYIDKFNIGYQQQLSDFIALARKELDQDTELLVGPETALQEGLWENKIEYSHSITKFRELQKDFPNLNILVGASTYNMFTSKEERTNTARQLRNENSFYDAYNSAIFIPDTGEVSVYHKTKLVPGAEKTPFPRLLDKLAHIMLDLGGISGSLGSSNKIHQFMLNKYKIQPLICYESIYGDLNKGTSDFIVIITNDGWWKNTAGYKQHFIYSTLRSIEQRKPIIRSANTGISAFINEKGDVLLQSEWNEAVCFSANVIPNSKATFYSIYGDYIGRLSVFIFVILFLVTFIKSILRE